MKHDCIVKLNRYHCYDILFYRKIHQRQISSLCIKLLLLLVITYIFGLWKIAKDPLFHFFHLQCWDWRWGWLGKWLETSIGESLRYDTWKLRDRFLFFGKVQLCIKYICFEVFSDKRVLIKCIFFFWNVLYYYLTVCILRIPLSCHIPEMTIQ